MSSPTSFVTGRHTDGDWMTEGSRADEPPTFTALDIPAHAGARDVILIVRKSGAAAERVVLAVSGDEARWLYNEGRLTGWVPNE